VPGSLLRLTRIAAWCAALTVPGAAAAQGTGDGFLFGRPVGTLGLQAGWDAATASSDLFDYITRQLTLGRADFGGPSISGDAAVFATPRLAVGLVLGYADRSARSEFRDFVDNANQPIEQTTRFRRVPLMAHVRWYLADRGRSVGRFAWIPRRITPYLGAGAGAMYYRFRQDGDFIDFQTLDVFPTTLEASGWAPMAAGFAGVEWTVSPVWRMTAEARHTWSRGATGEQFVGFAPLDLGGVGLQFGLRANVW
jgi:hypothetical protein